MLTSSRINAISLPSKISVVICGYIMALLAASAAVWVRMAFTDGPDAQASSGMYAFGDAVVFIGTFGLCALVPSGAALFLLRSCNRFWGILSLLGLVMGTTGIAAVIVFAIGRHATGSPLAIWAEFSVLRILGAPLLLLTFLVCALFSPHRPARIALIITVFIEGAVSAYGGIVWFAPLVLGRQ